LDARNTAVDVKAAEPQTHASREGKGKKVSGKAGHSSGLISAPRKGENAFFRLMSAKLGSDRKSALPDSPEGLETAARAAVAARAALGAKTAALASLTKTPQQQLGVDEASGKGEKADGKKKLVRPQSLRAAGAVGGDNADLELVKLAEGAKAKKEEAAAEQASAGSSRTAAGKHAEAKVVVVDLRKRAEAAKIDDAAGAARNAQAVSIEKEPSASFSQKLGAVRDGRLDVPQKSGPALGSGNQTALERLREMAGSELLRATTIVLNDGGGEIRLVLKPESLGSVRIRMNLVDNSIEGRIIVDNSAVKQVFDANIDALKRALTAEGFQTGSLQVSVGGQNGDGGRQAREHDQPEAVRRLSAQGFERNVPGVENVSLGDLLVNLFV